MKTPNTKSEETSNLPESWRISWKQFSVTTLDRSICLANSVSRNREKNIPSDNYQSIGDDDYDNYYEISTCVFLNNYMYVCVFVL